MENVIMAVLLTLGVGAVFVAGVLVGAGQQIGPSVVVLCVGLLLLLLVHWPRGDGPDILS